MFIVLSQFPRSQTTTMALATKRGEFQRASATSKEEQTSATSGPERTSHRFLRKSVSANVRAVCDSGSENWRPAIPDWKGQPGIATSLTRSCLPESLSVGAPRGSKHHSRHSKTQNSAVFVLFRGGKSPSKKCHHL